jgi:hypothetical protein
LSGLDQSTPLEVQRDQIRLAYRRPV